MYYNNSLLPKYGKLYTQPSMADIHDAKSIISTSADIICIQLYVPMLECDYMSSQLN